MIAASLLPDKSTIRNGAITKGNAMSLKRNETAPLHHTYATWLNTDLSVFLALAPLDKPLILRGLYKTVNTPRVTPENLICQ